MDQEQKRKTVAKSLLQFSEMPGYPKTEAGFDGYVKAFSKIVHVKTPGEIYNRQAMNGEVTDLEWLCEKIWESCEFFPRPIQARAMFQEKFPPADGISAEDLAMGPLGD